MNNQCLEIFEELDGVRSSKNDCFHFLRIKCQIIEFSPFCDYSSKVGEHPDTPFNFRFGGCYLNIYLEVICIKQSQHSSGARKVLEVVDVEAEEEGTEN